MNLERRRKWTPEELEQLAIEIENNPAKYSQCWSKPWADYTWRELLELWTPDNSKPH
jgi:hypothetical protein